MVLAYVVYFVGFFERTFSADPLFFLIFHLFQQVQGRIDRYRHRLHISVSTTFRSIYSSRYPKVESDIAGQLSLFNTKHSISICDYSIDTSTSLSKVSKVPLVTDIQLRLFSSQNAFIMGKLLPPSSSILLSDNFIMAGFGVIVDGFHQDVVKIQFDPNVLSGTEALNKFVVSCTCVNPEVLWCR